MDSNRQMIHQCQTLAEAARQWPTLIVIAVLAFGGLASGCAPVHNDVQTFMKDPRPMVTSTEYRIAPPDILRFYSRNVAEISEREATVRPDGSISVPLLGTVAVAGKTPEEVGEMLTDMAGEYYERPDVTVSVVGYRSKKIYVFGEVTYPGAVTYDGANTVLETLAEAQPTRLADFEKVQIVRPAPDPANARQMTVNLKRILKQGDTSRDAVLEEGDIVYLPPNPLAAVGLAFQQLLLPLQPAAATVNTPLRLQSGFQRSSGEVR